MAALIIFISSTVDAYGVAVGKAGSSRLPDG